jgi:regulatory protein
MADKAILKIALDKAMAQCSRREFCSDDIRSKLSLWGVEKNDAEKIIKTLIKGNYINESRYAIAFAHDKFKYNKWGKVKIAGHLKLKKLPPEVISSALDSIDNEQYTKLLRGIIEGHRRTIKARNQYDLKAKLLRYGLSKGYESSLLNEILNELD